MQPITIKDIAKLLGISKSTVSRALNDHPDISDKTKLAVMRVAKSLNYNPNTVAASLRYKKSKVIGLIVQKLSHFFFPSVIEGIEEVVNKMGYTLMVLQSNEQYEREVEACDILQSYNIEGLLASVSRTTLDFNHFNKIIEAKKPVVFFDRIPTTVKADTVLLDDLQGAYLTTKHLIDCGSKRPSICIGNPNLLISQNRLKGFKQACEESNIDIEKEFIISGEFPHEAEKAMDHLLKTKIKPDSVFAISDLTMSGITQSIRKNNLNIPNDIQLAGFCEEPFRSMYHPSITSFKPMGYEIGKTAAETLFMRINNPVEGQYIPQSIYLQGELIKGGSTHDVQ